MLNNLRLKLLGWAATEPIFFFTTAVGTPLAFLPFIVRPLRERFSKRGLKGQSDFIYNGQTH